MSIDNQRSPEGDDQQAEQQGAAQPEKQWQRQAQGQHDTQKATSQSEGEDTSDGAVLYEVDEISASKAHPREGVPGWKWISLVAVGLIGGVVHGYDLSNVANIQATLYESFGHIELLPFLPLGYSMAQGCGAPLVKRFSTFIDLKILLILGEIVFSVGAAVCGSATSMPAFIVGRVVKGLGGAFMIQSASIYIVLFSAPTELAAVQGGIGFSWVVGMVLGPIIGALFAENEHVTWRWAFYIIVPFIMGITLPLTVFGVPRAGVQSKKSLAENLATVDWVGFVLHSASMALFAITVIFSGSTWEWKSGSAIAAWVILGLVLIAYACQQKFRLFTTPEYQLIPIHSLRNRTVLLATLGTAMMSCSHTPTLAYIPLYFSFTRGDGPISSAVRMLPYVGTFIGFVLLAGGLLPAIRRYAAIYLFAGLTMVGGAAYMTTAQVSTSDSRVMGTTALIGVGVGMTFPIGVSIMAFVLPRENGADAALLNLMALSVMSTVSLSITGTLYENLGHNGLRAALAPYGFSDNEIREALAGVSAKLSVVDHRVQELASQVVAGVIAKLFYLTVASGSVVVIASLFMNWEALDFKGRKAAELADSGIRRGDEVGEKAGAREAQV